MLKFTLLIFLVLIFVTFVYRGFSQRLNMDREGCFKGIMTDSNQMNIDVIVLHGTGINKGTYADKMIKYCINDLSPSETRTELIYPSEDHSIYIRKTILKLNNLKKLTFYVMYWSDYTQSQKDSLIKLELAKNKNISYIPKRLKRNILIGQFYDFVAFSNKNFKLDMKHALDTILDEIIINRYEEGNALNIISGSLGSSILVEYINLLNEEPNEGNELFKERNDDHRLNYVMETPNKFYMLTNQIGFLEPIIAQKQSLFFVKPNMQVVAFRHSNDALSFYLPLEVASNFINYMTVEVINVRYKNFWGWNGFIKAHEKPFELKKLYREILYGYGYPKGITSEKICNNKKP